MQLSEALRIYILKVALPGFAFTCVLGLIFGWLVSFISEQLELFATDYQYGLILPSFIALGIILWAVYIGNDLYLIIKNRKSLEDDSID